MIHSEIDFVVTDPVHVSTTTSAGGFFGVISPKDEIEILTFGTTDNNNSASSMDGETSIDNPNFYLDHYIGFGWKNNKILK